MEGSASMKEMHEGASKEATLREMQGPHAEMMKSAQGDLAAMRAQLLKMREQAARVPDAGRKEEMQLNNDMWQLLIDHMDAHMTKMSRMMQSKRDGALRKSMEGKRPERYAQ